MGKEKRPKTKAKYEGKSGIKQKPNMKGREKRHETKPIYYSREKRHETKAMYKGKGKMA